MKTGERAHPAPKTRSKLADAAFKTAMSSSAVEGIYEPFKGKAARDAAAGKYVAAQYPGKRQKR